MIFSAIGAAVAGIGGLLSSTMLAGGIGSLLLKAAVGIGLNLAAQALAGKPEGPSFAIQGQLQSGGDVPRAFMLGYTSTAGSLVYANTWGSEKGTPNAYLTQVIALSDLPIRELVDLWINGEKVTIKWDDTSYGSRGFPVKEYWTDSGGNHVWVKFYDGTQTTADSFLVNTVSSAERPYQATRVGYGVSYMVVTTQINEELFTGFPQFKAEVYGLKLYDVTKDSTAGGSGSHRWSDPSTWGGDGDFLPAVQAYNLWRGLYYGGAWFYGLQGVTAARLPADHWRAQIQKCRAVIRSGGADVPTYRSGAEIAVSAPLGDASEALLTSCQGRMSEAGGVYKIFVGAPDAPVASFTDGEIISTEEQSFTPFFGLADSINGIAGKYPNPAEAWNVKVAPPIYRADLEAKDGNRRLMADVSFDFVPYADQVQRLMKSALEEAQRARRHTTVLPPEFWVLEPGDTVSWTSARNGYVNKLFRVDGVIDRANLDVMIDITEVDPADYDWNDATDYRAPVDGPVGIVRPEPQPIIDWFAEGEIEEIGGKKRSGIRLTWDGDQIDVARVIWEVRRADTLEVVLTGGTDAVARGSAFISENLFSNTDYAARGRYVPASDRATLWSDWLPVRTPDQPFTDVYVDIDLDEIAEGLRDDLEWIGQGTRDLILEAQRNALLTADQDFGNYRDKQQLRQELKSTFDNAQAAWTLDILTATGPGSALSQRLEMLEVKVDTKADASAVNALTARVTANEGSITSLSQSLTSLTATVDTKADASAVNLLSARVDNVDGKTVANANAITALTVQVGDIESSVTMRSEAAASPGGGWSRWGVQVKTGSGNAWSNAAFFLDVDTAGVSRAVFDVDQFVVTAGGGATYRPFVIQNNAVYADQLYVDAAKIVNLEVDWANITNVNITSAQIGDLTVKTSNLDFDQVTARQSFTGNTSSKNLDNNWYDVQTVTIYNENPNPVLCQYSVLASVTPIQGGSATNSTRIINKTTGEVVASVAATGSGGSGASNSSSGFYIDDSPTSRGNYVYAIQRRHSAANSNASSNSGTLKMLWWKR